MAIDRDLLGRLSGAGQLLMLAAGPEQNDGLIAEHIAAPGLDWSQVYWLAERERASLTLWRRLRGIGTSMVPSKIREALERRAMIGAFNASYIEQRLGESLEVLEGAGIEPMLLKGAALAVTVYDGFADRAMGDLDVLVDLRSAERAWRLLQRARWRWDEEAHPISRYVGHHHLPPLFGAPGMEAKIEIHGSLFVEGHPFQLNLEVLRKDAVQVRVGRGRGWSPSPPKLLLHAAAHFGWSHMMAFGAWRAFRDVAALAPTISDWQGFVDLAEENRASSVCFWTLELASRLVGAPIPAHVLKELGQRFPDRGKRSVARHLAGDVLPSSNSCPSAALRRFMWELAIRPSRSGHGKIRPWILDDSLISSDQNGAGSGIGDRLFSHLRRLRDWSAYLGSLTRAS